MKILFLDQTGNIGGAERSLADVAYRYRPNCLVGLFQDGPYRELLEERGIPVSVLTQQAIDIRRESNAFQVLTNVGQILPLVQKVSKLARQYDLIYANTPKALVVGAIASLLSKRPLFYHLRDILVPEHFSTINRKIIVTLANRFASQVIAVSEATGKAFIEAGGDPKIVDVVYNGFETQKYQGYEDEGKALRHSLDIDGRFVVGHFSRLAHWKGQHILIEAVAKCPDDVLALLVGDALFGEEDYVQQLKSTVAELGLQNKVRFMGFQKNIPQLMAACDVIAHTSIAPEPCSRVLIESMLGARPLIATQDGGSVELVEDEQTGWLVPPNDPHALAEKIKELRASAEYRNSIASQAQTIANQRFSIDSTWQQVDALVKQVVEV